MLSYIELSSLVWEYPIQHPLVNPRNFWPSVVLFSDKVEESIHQGLVIHAGYLIAKLDNAVDLSLELLAFELPQSDKF